MRDIIAKQEELEKMRVSQLANIHARNYYNSHDEEERLLSEYFELNNRIKIAIKDVADLNEQLKQAESEPKELAEIKGEDKRCPECGRDRVFYSNGKMNWHCRCGFAFISSSFGTSIGSDRM